MKRFNKLLIAAILTISLIGFSRSSQAATYTATASGNWSAAATWGGTAPAATISGADAIVISVGIAVTLDENVTISNTLASVAVADTLSGSNALTISAGTLSGAGSIGINGLNIGSSGYLTATGNITVSQFSNSQLLLAIGGATVNVSNSVTFSSGVVQLNSGSSVHLASNVTLNMAGGSLSINGGTIAMGGSYNLVYSGSVSAIGLEASVAGLNDLTVNLSSPSAHLVLASDLTVGGALSVQSGVLDLATHNLTINGTVSSSSNGSISASSASNISINGSGIVGSINFSGSGNTVGSLTVNIGASGSVSLGSDLTVSGALNLSGGSIAINSNTLTLNGTVSSSGSGSLSGSSSSNLTLSGSGSMGSISFASGSTLNNLTLNINSAGSASLGSNLSVGGMLTLTNGTLDIGTNNLSITGSGSIQGGSSASYVLTSSSGSLIMTLANAGASAMFHVGTMAHYAPVAVTNNSSSSGSFNVNAHSGVYANGTSGSDISATRSAVNTSWNVESSISSGANVNLEMYWNTSMEANGFDHTQAYVSHYVNSAWNTTTTAAATAHGSGSFSLALNGVTSFSPFAVFDRNTSTGIAEETTVSNTLSIYPIPAQTLIYMSSIDPAVKYSVSIYNSSGQLVLSRVENNDVLDISSLSNGAYNVMVNQQGAISRGKIVVAK